MTVKQTCDKCEGVAVHWFRTRNGWDAFCAKCCKCADCWRKRDPLQVILDGRKTVHIISPKRGKENLSLCGLYAVKSNSEKVPVPIENWGMLGYKPCKRCTSIREVIR